MKKNKEMIDDTLSSALHDFRESPIRQKDTSLGTQTKETLFNTVPTSTIYLLTLHPHFPLHITSFHTSNSSKPPTEAQ